MAGALRPLEEALGEPLPFVVVRAAADLRPVLVRLHARPEQLDEMQRRTREWWARVKDHFGVRMRASLCVARSTNAPDAAPVAGAGHDGWTRSQDEI